MVRQLGYATAIFIGLALPPAVLAYEVDTHAAVGLAAFDRSTAAQAQFGQRLGIDRLDATTPFRVPSSITFPYSHDGYLDNQASDWTALAGFPGADHRIPQVYDRAQMPEPYRFRVDPNGARELEMRAWFLRGIIREDDLRASDYEEGEVLPDADPYGEIVRVFHHFYDPVHDVPLFAQIPATPFRIACSEVPSYLPYQLPTGLVLGSCAKATDWAFDSGSSRRNHFTWTDAREAEWCALTYHRNDGRSIDSAERRVCLATAFMALGHVSHLLQDMSQPQHVRNDPHNPPDGSFRDVAATTRSRRTYEIWTNYRATAGQETSSPKAERENFATLFGPANRTPLVLNTNYPTPQFSTPIKFFTTRSIETTSTTSPDPLVLIQRRGIADLTNRSVFSEGTVLSTDFPLPPPSSGDSSYTVVRFPVRTLPGYGTVFEHELQRSFVDTARGTYVDAILQGSGGRIPLARESMWFDAGKLQRFNTIVLDEYSAQADVLIPRAVAYTAGLIDYFFRGKLEVLAPTSKVVGVVNQGILHNVVNGYPQLPLSPEIFGFKKLRLRIRNATDPVVESGTGESFPQYLGTPGGGGSPKGDLVAVARYHRNACYQPDLSGERVQAYGPLQSGVITEPTCDGTHPVRTGYEETSVSAPITIAAADLNSPSELDNLAAGTGVEKLFDFSADPIPINATDLFVQVVYRGRMGKQTNGAGQSNNAELDAIAVGTLDLREPTFAAFWNNTDYYWNSSSSNWVLHDAGQPNKAAKDFWVCAGTSPTKLVYQYIGSSGSPAMKDPVAANSPGMVRLGIIFPPPDFAGQQRIVHGTPVTFSAPNILEVSAGTAGRIVQASKDQISAAVLLTPANGCNSILPMTPDYWCSDAVQKRRGQIMGDPAQPLYLEIGAGTPRDVDSPSALPAFAAVVPLTLGNLNFDTDATLQACPPQIINGPTAVDALRADLIQLIEQARDAGVPIDDLPE